MYDIASPVILWACLFHSVTDLLLVRLGRGGECGCSVPPPAPHFTAASVAALRPQLADHFPRYRLLQSLLDDGSAAGWAQLSICVGLLMGYTVAHRSGLDEVDAKQVPEAWRRLTGGAPPQPGVASRCVS